MTFLASVDYRASGGDHKNSDVDTLGPTIRRNFVYAWASSFALDVGITTGLRIWTGQLLRSCSIQETQLGGPLQ